MSLPQQKDCKRFYRATYYIVASKVLSNIFFILLYAYSLTPYRILGYTSASEFELHVASLSVLTCAIQSVALLALKEKKFVAKLTILNIVCFIVIPLSKIHLNTEPLNFLALLLWFKLLSFNK